jgi:hypothetical protein
MKVNKSKGTIIGSNTRLDLPRFSRPKFADSLKFPNDITQLSAQNVSELLGRYTQMLAFVSEQHTIATIRILEAETRLSHTASKIVIEDPKLVHLERWRRDQVVDTDSRMMLLKADLLKAKKVREVGWLYCQNYERYISALSRELSRKLATNDGVPRSPKIY